MLSEQVQKLRETADFLSHVDFMEQASAVSQAADTIETLSAKLAATNMELESLYTSCSEEDQKKKNKATADNAKFAKNQDCFVSMDSDEKFHYRCDGYRGVICARSKKHYDE